MREIKKEKIYRLIDANFNRSKEGLRVCEDITRFVFDNKIVTGRYKAIRHKLEALFGALPLNKKGVIGSRNILRDVGKESVTLEFKRRDARDIFYSNSQRVKESLRVLEEFLKLIKGSSALEIKKIRYQVYELERKIVKEF